MTMLKDKPIKVFCKGCGEKIGEMKTLITPHTWKERYDLFNCPKCDRRLNRQFELMGGKK